MSNYNSFLFKAVIFDAFIMFQFYKMFMSGETDFDFCVFQNTIGKYTLCIFYGFISIISDSSLLRQTWSEMSFIRLGTRKKWIFKMLNSIFSVQAKTVVIAFALIILNSVLFRINIFFSVKILFYFTAMFLYLAVLNTVIMLAMAVVRKPEIAIGIGVVFNFAVLTAGHKIFYISIYYKEFSAVMLLLLILLIAVTSRIMNTRDIYTSKNASYIFEK